MSRFAFIPIAISSLLFATACSQTPIVVPVRSMERPQDIDFICLHRLDGVTWKGVPLEQCQLDSTFFPISKTPDYRLHAVITQISRGELASVDLGYSPTDPDGGQIVKVDPRLPGFTFLPVGKVPNDVAADPAGQAVYVASGRESRIDVIPAELLRGPVDTSVENGEELPWPHLDFTPSDGAPTRLTIVRDIPAPADPAPAYGAGRLYATLPDAVGGPKIAVFDLGDASHDQALLPPRLADIPLTFKEKSELPIADATCGKLRSLPPSPDSPVQPPWWTPLDACDGRSPTPPPKVITLPAYDSMRLGGIQLVGGLLFAADEKAPFIHVFDLRNGAGVEIQRIPIGVPTSRLAVSEPVPDEVTGYNAAAIEICEAQGWLGDGLDHTPAPGVDPAITSDAVGRLLPGGICRAHRYVYAVDFDDATLGDGTMAVVDVPVTFPPGIDGKPSRALEKIAFDQESLVQPMACESPSFPTLRIPLGSFGIGGLNGVPARAAAFVNFDPPSPLNAKKGVRCHPWDGPAPYAGGDALAQTSKPYIDASIDWRNGVDPRRLRGTFAFVVLTNGTISIVDIDDMDGLCRGPHSEASVAYFRRWFDTDPGDPGGTTPFGAGSNDEYLRQPINRHHPRSARFFNVDYTPLVVNLTLTRGTNALSFDPLTPEGQTKPHLVLMNTGAPKPYLNNDLVLPAADNPYTITAEQWTVTYQGALPGFGGTAGSFIEDDAGTATLIDGAGLFCNRGVEAFAPDRHDVVQIIEPVCEATSAGGPCTQEQHDACVKVYGIPDPTDPNQVLPTTRDLIIDQAFQSKLTIAQHFEVNASGSLDLKPGLPKGPTGLAVCFQGLSRYQVRARDTWVVIGSTTGYLHRVKADNTKPDLPCVIDDTKPHVYQGRVTELPSNTDLDKPPVGLCDRFVNPMWQFAIAQGYDDPTTRRGVASSRDMRFVFGTRFNFSPLTVLVGSLPTAIRPVAYFRNGVELLNWGQVATIDAIDRGLTVFNIGDLTGRQTL